MSEITVPDGFEDWPFDAQQLALAERNGMKTLRNRINDIVGMPHADEPKCAGNFTKEEMAAILLALGAPEEADG